MSMPVFCTILRLMGLASPSFFQIRNNVTN